MNVPFDMPSPSGTSVAHLLQREAAVLGLKPGNAARWHWVDPERKTCTRWSLVYFHGFTASPGECADVPERLGRALGANVHVARLPGHGLRADDALRGVTADDWIRCACGALAAGCEIGERVVLAGTSLGASLAMLLAARYPERVAGVVAWSLGVRAHNSAEFDRLCMGDEILRDLRPRTDAQRRYWSDAVHPDGYRALRDFFNEWMTPATAARVSAPFFLAYYYRNAVQQDRTASVPAMLELFDALDTPTDFKRACAYGEGTHVIASPWRSAVAAEVLCDTLEFLLSVRTLDHSLS